MAESATVPAWFWTAAAAWYVCAGLWVWGLTGDDTVGPLLRSEYHSEKIPAHCALVLLWALSPILSAAVIGYGLGDPRVAEAEDEPEETE